MNSYSVQLGLKEGVNSFFTTDNKEEAYKKALEWLEENNLSKDRFGVYDSIRLGKNKKFFNPITTKEITPDTTFKEQEIKTFFYGIN